MRLFVAVLFMTTSLFVSQISGAVYIKYVKGLLSKETVVCYWFGGETQSYGI